MTLLLRPSSPPRLGWFLATGLLLFFLLGSCSSAPRPAAAQRNWRADKLDALLGLADSKPAEAIDQALFLLGSPDPEGLDGRALAGVVDRAGARLAETLKNAEAGSDPGVGLPAAQSLAALARSDRALALLSASTAEVAKGAGRAAEGLLLAEAEGAWKAGNPSLGNALVAQALEPPLQPDGSLDAALAPWAARAKGTGSSSLAALIAAARPGAAEAAPGPDAVSRLDPALVARLEPAVITVRVDRGIKVEQGLGSPDRVLGSGFFIDPRGYLVTNYHVISSEVDPEYEGYSRVTIKPSGDPESRIPAKVIGWDPLLDLALLKAEMPAPASFVLDPQPAPPQGASIYALGSPLGLESTITSGIVSATGRDFLQWGDVIQIDAALNPGNSGGPLLDASGKVRGVVFAGMPSYQGLNFAVSASWLLRALPALYRGGKVEHPWLGYILDDAPKGQVGLPLRYRSPSVPPSIGEGDSILAVDGRPLSRVTELQDALLGREPGSLLSLLVRDAQGRERVVLRALGSRPEHPLDEAIAQDTRENLFPALMGMDVTRVPGGIFGAESFSVSKVRPGSVADEAGLSEGDPFALYGFIVRPKERAALLQIHVKKRKAGFLESIIQIPLPLDISNFV